MVEGPSERWAIPLFAKAVGTDLDEYALSLAEVGGSGYRVMMKVLGKDAFAVPWVIISDGEKSTLQALSHQLRDAGYATQSAVDAASTAGRLREDLLVPRDCFAYDEGIDFERLLIVSGDPELVSAGIDSVLGRGAFERFVRDEDHRKRGFATLPPREQLRAFFDSGMATSNKPPLARAIAESLTNGGTDGSHVPAVIRDALARARDLADEIQVKMW